MRRRTKFLLSGLAAVLVALGLFVYVNRRSIERQWHCYRVAAAESFDAAEEELAWFERGPDRRERLDELAAKWGTGSPAFDLYLARYVTGPASSDLMREVFSRELQKRPRLVARWAHYWAHQAPAEPREQLGSVAAYFDALAAEDPPPAITWREVLDLAALFEWTGRPELAAALKPDDWVAAYREWQTDRPEPLPQIERPAEPLPAG